MAGRNEGCASIGCAGICFLALLVAMCTGGGSGESANDGYVPHDPPSYSAPAPVATPSAPPLVVEDTRPAAPARELHIGPRGGCYYVTSSGNKTYVDRSACASIRAPVAPQPLVSPRSGSSSEEVRRSGGRQLHVGSRGGCYYMNGSGNKTYVDRSECAGIGVSDAPQPLVSSPATSPRAEPRRSGGRQLHVGPRGGCYYINGNSNKTYVDRSECH